MTSVSTSGLTVALGGQDIVHDVSLEFAAGGIVGIIGPNGAGKSTFLKALLGLLPARGTIAYGGVPLEEIGRSALARIASFLPQDREIAWPLSVENVVALGRTPYLAPMSGPTAADRAAVERAMTLTDVSQFHSRTIATLSGGERARVLMARVLAQETPVLIADEPIAALDPGHQIALLETLDALAKNGHTILVSLHDIALAARWCRRLVLLDRGRVAADGPPSEVLTPDIVRDVYGVRIHRTETDDGLLVQPVGRVRS